MRVKFFFLILPCLALSIVAQSQVEPEYIGQATTIDNVVLEKVKYEFSSTMKTGAFMALAVTGVGTTKINAVVEGVRSSTRVNATDTLCIVLNNGNNDMDPNEIFSVMKFEVNTKKKNRFVVKNETTFNSKDVSSKSRVNNVFYKKFGENSYLIKIANLPAGEYGIFSIASFSVICFAID